MRQPFLKSRIFYAYCSWSPYCLQFILSCLAPPCDRLSKEHIRVNAIKHPKGYIWQRSDILCSVQIDWYIVYSQTCILMYELCSFWRNVALTWLYIYLFLLASHSFECTSLHPPVMIITIIIVKIFITFQSSSQSLSVSSLSSSRQHQIF